jgi:hypothetical protein
MPETLRRIGRDLRNRRHVEAYAVAGLALIFAVLSVVGDFLPESLRWAALLAGVGLLVYQVTLPRVSAAADDLLHDRGSFDHAPFSARLERAREVWIFAPSAVNLLTPQTCDALRSKILARVDGVVRIVVLDPAQQDAVRLAARQLDDSIDYPVQMLGPSLGLTIERLRLMSAWQVQGSLEYRLLDFSPGFSLVAIDPGERGGTVIVEFHGFHNQATAGRMHMELTPAGSRHWYAYWVDQFDHIWQAARPQVEPKPAAGP